MYDFGKGVLKDDKQAASWYQKAAEQGYANAQSNLGAMYDFGKRVLKDNPPRRNC
jgi:TPR repeat protein